MDTCVRWWGITRNRAHSQLQMFSKQWLLLAEYKGEERHKMAATERKPGDGKKLRLVIRGSTKSLPFLLLGSLVMQEVKTRKVLSMDGKWVEGRRTDGIVVMEVPVYDPSDRKRKSHERQCDERARGE
ncbi:hypothetical protein ALC53_07214 [Atta colombica]|uniref:Uncharacterized protein n=1 Tax=Atta colombica TaxID=520822 RepID=A0A195BDD5_9HYME|nr:hypothetical protein ALC53_07214 [Atta colombica]